ncbi:N-acetylmuramoyl-L-alanine amidase family protein [Ectobacillus ponti]|uniref:N-acetylmuramoyl-L-alanine amidase n=1 Tax=Ectobacillus ponti TaxID=2961894 RepID=A0AA41X9F3_9BACI|nr:N-acetylmuramoyl-L-alanine amidase [Ectobacillus ponti]MCP8967816.1 N-acetylmuramoyl-L-alanine amidase [Ectobacillus ponti]
MIHFIRKPGLLLLMLTLLICGGCSGKQQTEEVKEKGKPQAVVADPEPQKPVAVQPPAKPEKPPVPPKKFLVYIDPGHQRKANTGQEPVGPGAAETKMKVTGGATGVATKKPEYVLALEASLILKELLEQKGFQVMMTRTTHDVDLSNRQRAEMANQQHADLLIRIHADSSESQGTKGLSVLTPSNQNPYTKAIYEDSLRASQLILSEVKKNSAVSVLGIRYRDDLSGFNWSKVPSTLVEMGYMSNPEEDRKMSDPTYLRALMGNLADGIVAYAAGK